MIKMKNFSKFTLMALTVTGVIIVAVAVTNRVKEARALDC